MRAREILINIERYVLYNNKEYVTRYTYKKHTIAIFNEENNDYRVVEISDKKTFLAKYTIDINDLYQVIKTLLIQIDNKPLLGVTQ